MRQFFFVRGSIGVFGVSFDFIPHCACLCLCVHLIGHNQLKREFSSLTLTRDVLSGDDSLTASVYRAGPSWIFEANTNIKYA